MFALRRRIFRYIGVAARSNALDGRLSEHLLVTCSFNGHCPEGLTTTKTGQFMSSDHCLESSFMLLELLQPKRWLGGGPWYTENNRIAIGLVVHP